MQNPHIYSMIQSRQYWFMDDYKIIHLELEHVNL